MITPQQKAFINHRENGFYLRFPNGNGLSTIWGSGSYSDNHFWQSPDGSFTKGFFTRIEEGSDTVETMPDCSDSVKAILDARFPENENGSVYGNLTFKQWLEMVNILNKNI